MNTLSTFIMQNYSAFAVFASSLVAALIQSFVENILESKQERVRQEKEKQAKAQQTVDQQQSTVQEQESDAEKKKNESKETAENNIGNIFAIGSLCYVLIFLAVCLLTVLFYAIIRVGSDFRELGKFLSNFLGYYIKKQWVEFLLVPLVTFFISKLIRLRTLKGSNWIIFVCAGVLAIATVASPYFLKSNRFNTLPLESEILTELRTMPFPFEGRIFNINSFQSNMDNGYWPNGKPENADPGPGPADSNNGNRTLVDKDINLMTIRELVQCVEYYHDNNLGSEVRVYLNKAYQIYLELGANTINDWNVIGRMFYYMGNYENVAYYQDAVDAFLMNNELQNAGYCYRNWYYREYTVEYARKALECYVAQVKDEYDTEDKYYTQSTVKAFIVLFVETYDKAGYNPFMDLLHEFCIYYDDVFLNTLDMSWMVANNSRAETDIVSVLNRSNRYLALEKYSYCPKLLLIKKTSEFLKGESISCADIYEIYSRHPDYFEQEDRINLVWLLYESGEYIKTYESAKDLSSIYGQNGSAYEEKYVMLLLKAESVLQNDEAMSEIDELQLYKDITSALDEMGVLSSSSESSDNVDSNDDNNHDAGEAIIIRDPIVARLRLAQCILAGRVGIDASYSGLSEICEELFNTDSRTGLYIVASLSYQDKEYAKAITLCNQIIDMVKEPDYFYNRVLFLKSDALIGLAKTPEGKENKDMYYSEADELLKSVRDMAGNDYFNALRRLSDLYELMGRFDEQQEIDDMLVKFG